MKRDQVLCVKGYYSKVGVGALSLTASLSLNPELGDIHLNSELPGKALQIPALPGLCLGIALPVDFGASLPGLGGVAGLWLGPPLIQ